MTKRVRFLHDDVYGLWKAGEIAEDLGWEQGIPEIHPDFIPLRTLKLEKPSGEIICLTDPFKRGLIEQVDSG